MPWFDIHTEEIVHGVYQVEAEDEQEARLFFMNNVGTAGDQTLYEAFSVDIEKIVPSDS
jgi:hypothetical protein